MLQAMRSHAGSWFIKVLLGAIVASFALWGIADIIRGYGENRPVATVGSQSITTDELRHSYKQMIARVQHMTKSALTPEQIKAMGLSSRLLENLIEKALIKEDIHDKGLVIDDDRIRHEIHSIPELMTKHGAFNHERFQQFLQAQGLSEGMFVQDIRTQMQKYQLFYSLSMGLKLSHEYARILVDALEQPHHFVAVHIPFAKMEVPNAPTPVQLDTFFKTHGEEFRRPEYRKVTLLCFERDVLKNTVDVTPGEIEAMYQERRATFHTPEKRNIDAVIFTSDAAARKAFDQISLGKPLRTVARDLKGEYKELGTFSKNDFGASRPDDMVNAVFNLKVGDTSKPYDVANGWIVFHVTEITPAFETSKEEAQALIESQLRDEKLNIHIEHLQNQVEDALAGGMPLPEIAKKYSLVLKSIPLIQHNGMSEDKASPLDPSIKDDVMTYVFSNKEGTESPMIIAQHKGDNMGDVNLMGVIARIDRVIPSHIPKLSDIQDHVIKTWNDNMRKDAAFKAANSVRKGASSIEKLKANAAKHTFADIEVLPELKRAGIEENKAIVDQFSPDAIDALFALPMGETLLEETPTGYKIIMLDSRPKHEADTKKVKTFEDQVSATLGRDLEEQYYNHARHHTYSVSINAGQVASATGEDEVSEADKEE